MKKYFLPLGVLGIFMIIAVTLWLTQDNIFYLFNFSYIGISIFFGIFLEILQYLVKNVGLGSWQKLLLFMPQ